jgi:hypothetical protein
VKTVLFSLTLLTAASLNAQDKSEPVSVHEDAWLDDYEPIGVWLEGIALILILGAKRWQGNSENYPNVRETP